MSKQKHKKVLRLVSEVGFLLFLFYTNMLMAEFTRSSVDTRLLTKLEDIFTPTGTVIGVVGAFIGYLFIERIRKYCE